jgi:pimeloyl-ACP methyl ester carboxylesterase
VTSSDYLVGRVVRNAWGPASPKLPHSTLVQFERPFRVAGTSAELRALVGHGLPGVSLGALAKIKVPRAVVWGADDTVDSVASGRESAAALGVRLELVPDAGHLSMLSQPTRVAERILAADRN